MPAERSESGCPCAGGQSNLCPRPEIFHALPVVLGRARAHQPGCQPPRMKPYLSKAAIIASALLLSAQAPAPQVPESETPGAEASEAPAQRPDSAPSEAELSPPPDSEKAPAPSGYVEVLNPASPNAAPPAPVVHRGRRYGLEDLSPYFADGKKKEARDAFDRGQYTRARELLKGEGDSAPVRYLRALSAV